MNSYGRHGPWTLGRCAFLCVGPQEVFRWCSARHGAGSLIVRRFSRYAPGMVHRAGKVSGPPALTLLPRYVFHAYNVTHSLVVWAVAFFLLWQLMKKPLWLLAAWLLHILCDIPTHAASYFPTPFLWPFPTPFVNGVPWSTPWFIGGELRHYVYCLLRPILLFP